MSAWRQTKEGVSMTARVVLKCLGFCLLAACCVWVTGCGGDGDGDGDTVVVTNVTGGVTVVVTNAPSDSSSVQMVAPQLIDPDNNAVFYTLILNGKASITFQWAQVPKAKTYVIEIDGTKETTSSTKFTKSLDIGEHKWRVWGVDADDNNGPASGKRTVKVEFKLLIPLPPPGP